MWNKKDAAITNAGLALMSNMLAGANFQITRAAVGSGFVEREQLADQTDVTDPLNADTNIILFTPLESRNGRQLLVRVTNRPVTEPSKIRQLGIYAKTSDSEEILFSIYQDEIGEELPPYAEMPDFMLDFPVAVPVSRTNNITVVVSATASVTPEDLLRAISAHNLDPKSHAGMREKSELSHNAYPEAGIKTHWYSVASARGYTPQEPVIEGVSKGYILDDSGERSRGYIRDDSGDVNKLSLYE